MLLKPTTIACLAVPTSVIATPCVAPPAWAAQSLIPTPYPGNVGGGQPLNPEPSVRGTSQEIIRDPYPQIMGSDSQGNPPITLTRRSQRQVPTVNERKYRVDRH